MSYYFNNNNTINSFNKLFDNLVSFDYDDFPAPANIVSNDKEILIELQAPGIDKKDIKIDCENNILSVSCDGKQDQKDTKYIQQQIFHDGFKNTFKLTGELDQSNISATMNNGILNVSVPRKKQKTKNRIKIT
jgi:HSP20 family protein